MRKRTRNSPTNSEEKKGALVTITFTQLYNLFLNFKTPLLTKSERLSTKGAGGLLHEEIFCSRMKLVQKGFTVFSTKSSILQLRRTEWATQTLLFHPKYMHLFLKYRTKGFFFRKGLFIINKSKIVSSWTAFQIRAWLQHFPFYEYSLLLLLRAVEISIYLWLALVQPTKNHSIYWNVLVSDHSKLIFVQLN